MKNLSYSVSLTVFVFLTSVSCKNLLINEIVTEQKLIQNAEIKNISCKGEVSFYDNNKLLSCKLAKATVFYETSLPEGSLVDFNENGLLIGFSLPFDSEIQGYLLKGDKDNGWWNAFYPNGKLKMGYLARSTTIHGVPCVLSDFWEEFFGGSAVSFYDNGNLNTCKLATETNIDGKIFSSGSHPVFDKNGKLMN